MGLFHWFARSAAPPVSVRLITGPRCPLCETMRSELTQAGVGGRIVLEELSIDEDRELKRRYGLRIPVLEIDGEEAFVGQATAGEIRARVLAAAKRRRRQGG